jgi:hypothetical protein
MKTYLIAGRYCGTQAEAREAAKAAGIRFDADQHTEEVPTDKDGLIAYLNVAADANDFAGEGLINVNDAPISAPDDRTCRPTAEGARLLAQGQDMDAVVDFIGQADAFTLPPIFEAAVNRARQLVTGACQIASILD